MNTATSIAIVRLELGQPPKSSNTKDMTKGKRIGRVKAARKAVAAAWMAYCLERFGVAPGGMTSAELLKVQQQPGQRWAIRALWSSPRPPKDQDNAAAALKPYFDACVQVVGRGRGGANKQPGEAPILIDDSDEHLAREIVIEKCKAGEEALVFEFSILEAGGAEVGEPDPLSVLELVRRLDQLVSLARRPHGIKEAEFTAEAGEAAGAVWDEALSRGLLIPRGGGPVHDAPAIDAAEADRRAEAWHFLEGAPTLEELRAFCVDAELDPEGAKPELVERLRAWHRDRPALRLISDVGEELRGKANLPAIEAYLEILGIDLALDLDPRKQLEDWHAQHRAEAEAGQACAWCAAIHAKDAEGGLVVFEEDGSPSIFEGSDISEAAAAVWACERCTKEISGDLGQLLEDVRSHLAAERVESGDAAGEAQGLAERAGLALDVGDGQAEIETALEGWLLEIEGRQDRWRRATEEPAELLPKWMVADQLAFEGFDGPQPCWIVRLKKGSEIDGSLDALVLARHDLKDKAGAVDPRFALAPLDPTSGAPITTPPLGHERTAAALDEAGAMSPNSLPEEHRAEVLSWWRAWVKSGHLMARTVEAQLRAIEAMGPAHEAVKEAQAEKAAAESAVKAAKNTLKGAEADLEAQQDVLNELVAAAQGEASWPWPERA